MSTHSEEYRRGFFDAIARVKDALRAMRNEERMRLAYPVLHEVSIVIDRVEWDFAETEALAQEVTSE